MHTHLTQVFARLDAQRAALRDAVDSVPPARRGERPGPDRWSVAEVLEHLSLVEARFNERIGTAITAARQAGLGPESAARIPLSSDLEARLNDRTRPRPAPEPLIPRGRMDHVAAWVALERGRETLRMTVTAADGLALADVTSTHPAFGTLNVYQWVEFVGLHEARHTEQIEEIAAQLG